jgi:hypothetical protein
MRLTFQQNIRFLCSNQRSFTPPTIFWSIAAWFIHPHEVMQRKLANPPTIFLPHFVRAVMVMVVCLSVGNLVATEISHIGWFSSKSKETLNFVVSNCTT